MIMHSYCNHSVDIDHAYSYFNHSMDKDNSLGQGAFLTWHQYLYLSLLSSKHLSDCLIRVFN